MFTTLVLATALAGSQITTHHGQPYLDYPLHHSGRFDLRGADLIDGLAIVQPVVRLGSAARKDGTPAGRFNVDLVEVVDSLAFAPGSQIRIVVPIDSRQREELFPMQEGARYLLLARRPVAGGLSFRSSHGTYSRRDGTLIRRLPEELLASLDAPNEVSGLALFRTNATRLSPKADPAERLADSVVDCLQRVTNDDVRRAFDFLRGLDIRPSTLTGKERFTPIHETELTLKMRRIAAGAPSFQRAKILWILLEWRVPHTAESFIEAMAEASKDPQAFSDERDSLITLDVTFGYERNRVDKPYRPNSNYYADIALAAKSPVLQRLFIQLLGPAPDATRQRRLAVLLNDPDRVIQELMISHYADWSGDKTKQPKRETVGGQYLITNLEELVEHWRQKFGVGKP